MAKIKVLFVTSEVAPVIKTGGLADVSSALPAALRTIGVDVRVFVPGYTQVIAQLFNPKRVSTLTVLPGFPPVEILSCRLPNGTPLLVLDCPSLYQREGGPYQDENGQDWPDNAQRFGLFSKVAALLADNESPLAWRPDVLHCNDWQTALAPAYLHFSPSTVRSLVTIHNLAFQGNFAPTTVQTLQLSASCFSVDGAEFYGNLSFLKAGLFYADHITTVSPNYAREIQQADLGFGMQGLLSERRDHLSGILNGIDTDEWDPASDPHLSKKYSVAHMAGKAANKQALQSKMGLNLEPETPLLGVVSRFTQQKGLDLLLEIAPRLIELPVQLALLGHGDVKMQQAARELALRYPGKIATVTGFNEKLSHQIEAGADMFVMPSRFEPCGLNQLYSQCYGTPPIVHATGGLVDSVVDCTAETLKDGSASGFMFKGMTTENLYVAIQRAVTLYCNTRQWKTLCKNCMSKNFSWNASAEAYLAIYSRLLS
ncbi:MAG TPA: glycogen synthase GlgA [Gallionella sp.]|nr:glycogen synthase GlgA [Gallionella sp.]